MESEGTHVVWWAFALGGFAGGAARVLLDGAFILPRVERLRATGQTVVVPGSFGPLLLGPVAAFVMAGAGAGAFNFQAAYDARGFWGPFIGSIPAGMGATLVLSQVTKAHLDRAAGRLLEKAAEPNAG